MTTDNEDIFPEVRELIRLRTSQIHGSYSALASSCDISRQLLYKRMESATHWPNTHKWWVFVLFLHDPFQPGADRRRQDHLLQPGPGINRFKQPLKLARGRPEGHRLRRQPCAQQFGPALLQELLDVASDGLVPHARLVGGKLEAGGAKALVVPIKMAPEHFHDLCDRGHCEPPRN